MMRILKERKREKERESGGPYKMHILQQRDAPRGAGVGSKDAPSACVPQKRTLTYAPPAYVALK